MNLKKLTIQLFTFAFISVLVYSCKKEEEPTPTPTTTPTTYDNSTLTGYLINKSPWENYLDGDHNFFVFTNPTNLMMRWENKESIYDSISQTWQTNYLGTYEDVPENWQAINDTVFKVTWDGDWVYCTIMQKNTASFSAMIYDSVAMQNYGIINFTSVQ